MIAILLQCMQVITKLQRPSLLVESEKADEAEDEEQADVAPSGGPRRVLQRRAKRTRNYTNKPQERQPARSPGAKSSSTLLLLTPQVRELLSAVAEVDLSSWKTFAELKAEKQKLTGEGDEEDEKIQFEREKTRRTRTEAGVAAAAGGAEEVEVGEPIRAGRGGPAQQQEEAEVAFLRERTGAGGTATASNPVVQGRDEEGQLQDKGEHATSPGRTTSVVLNNTSRAAPVQDQQDEEDADDLFSPAAYQMPKCLGLEDF